MHVICVAQEAVRAADEPVALLLLPAKRVGGVGDDGVGGEGLQLVHVERRHGAGNVVGEVEGAADAAITRLVHLDVVARRVPAVEAGPAAQKELLRKEGDTNYILYTLKCIFVITRLRETCRSGHQQESHNLAETILHFILLTNMITSF